MDRDKLASALYTLSEENPDNYRYIGRMFSFLKLFDSTAAYYTKAIQLDPGRKELYVNRGEVYYDMASDVNALKDFREAISLDHNYIDAFEKRGNLYADKMSKYELAIEDYSMVLRLEPERIEVFILRTDCWLNLGDTSNAINDFSSYVNYFPNDDIYYRWGRLFYSQANSRQAADDYTQAILMNNQEGVLLFQRHNTQPAWKNYLAIKDYEQFMNLSDGSNKPFNNMGYCYLSAGGFKMAEYCFNIAVESDTENFDSYLDLAVMHYRLGKMKRACECIVKAIKIKPVIEKGSEGLDEIKKSGFFWEENELKDLNKIFMVMGIDNKTIQIKNKAGKLELGLFIDDDD